MPTITPSSLTGSTADASVDATTLLFRRMADRGDGKDGAADGIVSDAEAKTFVTEVENLGLFHIKTTKNNSLDTHEQIGALEFEMRRLDGLGQSKSATYQTLSAHVASLVQSLAQYDSATIEAAYKAKAGTTALPAGKLVGQYENIYFVSKNAGTAAEAQASTRTFIAEASKTPSGRFMLELLVKQDNGKPIVITLDDAQFGESESHSHNEITHYYKADQLNDPSTVLIHEFSHSAGIFWNGDIINAKQYASIYKADTNQNGISDAAEMQSVIENKWDQKHNPLKSPYTIAKIPDLTFDNFDKYYNGRVGPTKSSFTEHVAVFFEQAFRLERGLPIKRIVYQPPENPTRKPNPNLRGMPGPDEF